MSQRPDDESGRTIFVRPGQAPAAVPAIEAIGHYLVAVAGAEPGKRVEVGGVPLTIGRDPQQALVFSDAELSRRHACVSLVNGVVLVEDLGSMNGTFVDGARISGQSPLGEGSVMRVGSQVLRYERRSRSDVDRARELDRDLVRASNYVNSLLPAPIDTGAVRVDWRFVPSMQLGGDAFGYDWLDASTFSFYLVDVSGHGAGSAMHSVTVLNVLRQRALPQVDFRDPASVLSSLNVRFQMDRHNGLYFTMWYGVYDVGERTLVYSSAGHHPAYLVSPDKDAVRPLGQPALMIGVVAENSYVVQRTTVPAASRLYLFSDGVFEIVTTNQQRWALSDFLPLLLEPSRPDTPEPDRLYQAVRQAAAPGPLEDDFSLLAVTFP